jgi:hypothetical protein
MNLSWIVLIGLGVHKHPAARPSLNCDREIRPRSDWRCALLMRVPLLWSFKDWVTHSCSGSAIGGRGFHRGNQPFHCVMQQRENELICHAHMCRARWTRFARASPKSRFPRRASCNLNVHVDGVARLWRKIGVFSAKDFLQSPRTNLLSSSSLAELPERPAGGRHPDTDAAGPRNSLSARMGWLGRGSHRLSPRRVMRW